MTLRQVKNAVYQTECGEILRDDMIISEPIPSIAPSGLDLIDNFFIYRVGKKVGAYSGPVARLGIVVDELKLDYFVPCSEKPFSVLPDSNIPMNRNIGETKRSFYTEYEEAYNLARPLFYRSCGNDGQRRVLDRYLKAFKKYEDASLFGLYVEMTPDFFAWLNKQIERL